MNKNTIIIISTLAAAFVCAGCNKSGKLGQASTFTPPAGAVVLKQKWPMGEHIAKHTDMKMSTEIFVPNQPNPIKQSIGMGQKYGLTVAKEEADGGHVVEMEFQGMNMKLEQAGKTVIDYDSEHPSSEAAAKDPQAAIFQKMFGNVIGAKLQYYLNATNGLEQVEGVDALMGRLTSGAPAGALGGIKNMFNEGYLKEMIGDSRNLPPQAVQPGDAWPVEIEMAMGEMGACLIDYNYTFIKWEKHGQRMCARLEFDGTLKGKPVSEANPKGLTMAIQDGTLSGVSWFDPELGTTIDSSINQDLNLVMTMQMNMQGKTVKQTTKMLMHQVIAVKLDSVK